MSLLVTFSRAVINAKYTLQQHECSSILNKTFSPPGPPRLAKLPASSLQPRVRKVLNLATFPSKLHKNSSVHPASDRQSTARPPRPHALVNLPSVSIITMYKPHRGIPLARSTARRRCICLVPRIRASVQWQRHTPESPSTAAPARGHTHC